MKPSDQAAAKALFDTASAARANAYAPYSKFKVGAAILTETGEIFAGANVENASYPNGTCAEAGAIAAMVAAGGRVIAEALIIGDATGRFNPCGACRQRLREFAGPGMRLHVAGPDGIQTTYTLDALLPLAFTLEPAPRG